MGSMVELNDTLQISEEQGFPCNILNIEKHKESPYSTKDFENTIFSFKNKPAIRLYHRPPVRNFLVQNIKVNGVEKWIYWGLIHILEVTHDYVNQTTSGKYKIMHINDIEEMKQAFNLIDRRDEFNYF